MKKAKITAEKSNVVSKIDKRIYGSFVEHVGRGIYTGIYEPGHPEADEAGFRKDVLKLVKELDVPIVRYPGGNFVSNYDWEDGVGPVAERPKRLSLAWGVIEDNEIGLNEFSDWSKKSGAETMMAVNLGTRGIAEARDLVEYCNYPSGTKFSDLRIKHGYKDPHKIKTWCLGNEVDGPWQIGHRDAREYGAVARESAKIMRLVDPSIELVACGTVGRKMPTFGSWEETVLNECYDFVDYMAIHCYYGNAGDDQSFLSMAEETDEFIKAEAAVCDAIKYKLNKKKTMMISVDEWNVSYHKTPPDPSVEKTSRRLEEHYFVEDAVVVGTMMISIINNADRVKIGCLSSLVNTVAPIMTEPGGGVWKQTIYYPYLHASRYGRGAALRLDIDSPKYSCRDFTDVSQIVAAAVNNEEKSELTFFIVNRHLSDIIEIEINLIGFNSAGLIEALTFGHSDTKQSNGPDESKNITPVNLTGVIINNNILNCFLNPVTWNTIRIKYKIKV